MNDRSINLYGKHNVRILDEHGKEVNHLYGVETTESGVKISINNEEVSLPDGCELIGTGMDLRLPLNNDRSIPFEEDATCDTCGTSGALDFMGDYRCIVCISNMADSDTDDLVSPEQT